MPSTIILYDQLSSSGAETGGTWARVSPTGPTAPAAYNDPVDFTGFPYLDYVYSYTKGLASALVTVSWRGDTPARINSNCASSTFITADPVPPPYEISISDDSAYVCGIHQVSGGQELPLPSSWNQGTYSGDLWYVFTTAGRNSVYLIQIIVDGTDYFDQGIYAPAIEIFTHSTSGDCIDNVQVAHQASNISSQLVSATISIPGDSTPRVVRFRISSVSGYEGKFDVTIKGLV